jgi:acyl dehydratase
MTFAVIEITYRNRLGEAVLVSRRTLIETQPRPAPAAEAPAARVRRSPSFEEIEVGDAAPPLVIGPMTRTDFVKFAGASGDFNPNHHDELHAIRSGYDRIFAMGPLSGAYLSRLLTDWLGDGALRRFGLRFMAQLWPGDVLTCTGIVTKKYEADGVGLVDCEACAENQRKERVVEGTATAALPRRGHADRKGGAA